MLSKNKSRTNIAPPVGITPKFIIQERRRNEIQQGVRRYLEADKELPLEWIEEYNELCRSLSAESNEDFSDSVDDPIIRK